MNCRRDKTHLGPVSPGLEKREEQGDRSDGEKPGLGGMRSHQGLERNMNSNQRSNEEFIANDTTGGHSSFWKLKMIALLWVCHSVGVPWN